MFLSHIRHLNTFNGLSSPVKTEPINPLEEASGETNQSPAFSEGKAYDHKSGCHYLHLTGKNLSLNDVYRCVTKKLNLNVAVDPSAMHEVHTNHAYLAKKIDNGHVIYGINTGYGGSADVRSSNIEAMQRSLVTHLNAGFGRTFDDGVVRGVMLARANSLLRAMSGVRQQVVQHLVDMINSDITPTVPLRGSVSASGDLMPTSYIAGAMMAAPNIKVSYKGEKMPAIDALSKADLKPITFQTKEALAVLNAASFASVVGACVLVNAKRCLQLTKCVTGLAVECLQGRVESFSPIVHDVCMPHQGNIRAAADIRRMLKSSNMAITQLEMDRTDVDGTLKQDRYPLRTSPQWLGPAHDTLKSAECKVMIELNSTNDNPIIDHHTDSVLHSGNFQGASLTVAMDQTRQAVQMCGKLLFAQMSEIVNVSMNQGLPPNLAGSNVALDFGFKGTDTAMASYCSELDWLTPPLTSHVLSAEIGNQAVNSMALVSARKSEEAVEILHMMIANSLTAFIQAVDLRWLQGRITERISILFDKYNVDRRLTHPQIWPWYQFAFCPEQTACHLLEHLNSDIDKVAFTSDIVNDTQDIMEEITSGKCINAIMSELGEGTQKIYHFVRVDLGVKFYDGQRTLDSDLQTVYDSLTSEHIDALLDKIYKEV